MMAETTVSPPDDSTAALAQAAKLFAKAAEDKANRGTILKEMEAVLSKVKLVDFPDLEDSTVVRTFLQLMDTRGMRPGEIRNRGTLAEVVKDWSWRSVQEEVRAGRMKLVKFIPNETLTLTWNGLPLQVVADQEVEVPEPFYNIWKDHRYAIKQAQQHEQYLMGRTDVPPDPNWVTVEGAGVRMWSTQGKQFGKVSGHLGVGPIYEGEEAAGG